MKPISYYVTWLSNCFGITEQTARHDLIKRMHRARRLEDENYRQKLHQAIKHHALCRAIEKCHAKMDPKAVVFMAALKTGFIKVRLP